MQAAVLWGQLPFRTDDQSALLLYQIFSRETVKSGSFTAAGLSALVPVPVQLTKVSDGKLRRRDQRFCGSQEL